MEDSSPKAIGSGRRRVEVCVPHSCVNTRTCTELQTHAHVHTLSHLPLLTSRRMTKLYKQRRRAKPEEQKANRMTNDPKCLCVSCGVACALSAQRWFMRKEREATRIIVCSSFCFML